MGPTPGVGRRVGEGAAGAAVALLDSAATTLRHPTRPPPVESLTSNLGGILREAAMLRSVVLGVDSSTQSTKVLAVDVETGAVAGEGRAPHSGADVQHPAEWWDALRASVRQATAWELSVAGIAVAGQQHGCVTLDAAGEVVRPAPLWNNVAAA